MTTDQLLAELEARLAARRERKMSDYKVVPVEPIGWISSGELSRLRRRKVCAVIYAEKQAEGFTPLFLGRPAPDVAELQAELARELQRRFDGNEQASREHREDVSALVEALESLLRHAEKLGRKSAVYDRARAALAAHRKMGGKP